jgi:hypothetical protein
MNRYGIPTAPNGCGNEAETGACFNCTARTLRRARWAIRQLLPLKYATHYFTNVGCDNGPFVNVDYWRMWFGRVFAHKHYSYRSNA